VSSRNLVNEEAIARAGLQNQREKKALYKLKQKCQQEPPTQIGYENVQIKLNDRITQSNPVTNPIHSPQLKAYILYYLTINLDFYRISERGSTNNSL
jgi:hypothetical protein